MTIKCKEYPDIWVYSDDNPAPPPNYPKDSKVDSFLDIFLTHQFFNRVVIWGASRFNRRFFRINKEQGFYVITWLPEAESLRQHFIHSCEQDHMSVLFVPENPTEFLRQILKQGHYGEPILVSIGTGNNDDPLRFNSNRNVDFIESDLFHPGESIFTFTHDAQYLYEIFR